MYPRLNRIKSLEHNLSIDKWSTFLLQNISMTILLQFISIKRLQKCSGSSLENTFHIRRLMHFQKFQFWENKTIIVWTS